MKNILKITVSILFSIVLFSCTNDKDNEAVTNGFELRKDASIVSPSVLSSENDMQLYTKLEWDRSNYGVPTEASYSVLVSDHDADPNFEHAVESVVGLDLSNDARKDSLSVGDFNTLINALTTFNCNQMNIDIRIKSKLGISTNALIQYSNPITVAVTGYSKLPAILSLATDAATAATASRVKSSNYNTLSDYEGFMYLEPGNYRFFQPNPCGEFTTPAVYGISGGNTGTVTLDGTTGYTVATAGHYFVKVNMTAGTYSITPFNTPPSFGLFGNAKGAIGFGNTTVMNYDVTSKKWTLTISLINGKKFGFKTGNGATPAAILTGMGTGTLTPSPLTVTTTVDNTGSIKVPGDYINDATKTKYDVEVDVSNPRAYTYKLTLNTT